MNKELKYIGYAVAAVALLKLIDKQPNVSGIGTVRSITPNHAYEALKQYRFALTIIYSWDSPKSEFYVSNDANELIDLGRAIVRSSKQKTISASVDYCSDLLTGNYDSQIYYAGYNFGRFFEEKHF